MLSSTVFKHDLEKDVAGDTSGNFAKLLLALVQVRSTVHFKNIRFCTEPKGGSYAITKGRFFGAI